MENGRWGVLDSGSDGLCLDSWGGLGDYLDALLIKSSGGAGPVKLRQPDLIFGWDWQGAKPSQAHSREGMCRKG